MSHEDDIEKYKKWLSQKMNIPVSHISVVDLYIDEDGFFHYKITIAHMENDE